MEVLKEDTCQLSRASQSVNKSTYKDISGVSLTTRGTTKEQGHLTIGHSLLGQVIVDDQSVFAIVTEPFTHSASKERRQVLKRGSFGGSGGNDDRLLQSVVLVQCLNDRCDF